MKILLATMGMDIGGAETHILSLSLSLKAIGYQVEIASADGVFVKKLEQSGIIHHKLPLNKRSPFAFIKSYFGLKKIIKSGNYDIVHAHARIPAFLCGKLQRKYGFRFVTTCHFNFKLGITKKYTDWGEHVFSISQDIDDYLKNEYRIPSKMISRAVNGIDTVAFSPTKDLEKAKSEIGAEGKKVILHTGRLDKLPSKVAETLLDLSKELFEKNKDILIIIVGDGSRRTELTEKAHLINNECGIEIVRIVGPTDNVYKYISASDIFVAPSRSAMEAMSCAVPTIIAGHQGYIGCYDDSKKQVCLDTNLCGRGKDIFEKDKLLTDLHLLLNMDKSSLYDIGQSSRKFILDNYSVEKMTKQYTDVYDIICRVKTKAVPDTVICGYYGKGNVGDELLLRSIVTGLRNFKPSISIGVISGNPKKTSRQYIVTSVSRFDIFKINKLIKQSGQLILGGGNILQDKTSFRSLYYYYSIVRKAKKNGARVVMLSNGLGPILREKSKKYIRKVLELSDYVSLRDDNSVRIASELCSKKIIPTFDSAVNCYIPKLKDTEEKYFVIAPKKTNDLNEEKTEKLINELKSKYSAKIFVVPFHEKEDEGICQKLCYNCGAELFNSNDAEDISELFSHSIAVISSRLHALVISGNSGTPFISISDDEKLKYYKFALEEEKITGKTVSYSYDFDVTSIIDTIDYMDENRVVIRDYLLSVTKDASESNEEEIRNILHSMRKNGMGA